MTALRNAGAERRGVALPAKPGAVGVARKGPGIVDKGGNKVAEQPGCDPPASPLPTTNLPG